MKKIILVTHGKAQRNLPDPGLTEAGKKQMEELRIRLLKEFNEFDLVIVGLGKRHKEACQIILGARRPDIVSEIVGVPDALSSNEEHMILADGEKIPVEKYIETRYKEIKKRIKPFLEQLFGRTEKNILIVGGRIVAIGAGTSHKKVKSAHIYHMTLTSSGKIRTEE